MASMVRRAVPVTDPAACPGPCQVAPGGTVAPLSEVTFAVVDVETTGMSPDRAALTEVAAALFRGGECLRTFQSLVDPGMPIPPRIIAMTGITDSMVRGAPPASSVLPRLMEVIGDAVVVGHNVRFDLSFLNAASAQAGLARIGNPILDTLALSRRFFAGDFPGYSLGALASALGLAHRPTHRSLDDVLATADLLHLLIEVGSGYGVRVLADLVESPDASADARGATRPVR